jgi:broad specificity phosphatase PhoE
VGAVELVLVRHGESLANVLREHAWSSGAEIVEMPMPDPQVPITEVGAAQSAAVGRWLGALAPDRAPEAVWCSSYLRARQTARVALDAAGPRLAGLGVRVDERLRDRELGVLDLLTGRGIEARFSAEARRRAWLGKFAYRPPGGESWADLAFRVRSVLRDIDDEESGRRVLVVAHDALVLLFRYVCERLDESELTAIMRSTSVANASITRLVRPSGAGAWSLDCFNVIEHLAAGGTAPDTDPATGMPPA